MGDLMLRIRTLQQKLVIGVAIFVSVTGILIAAASYHLSAKQQEEQSLQQINAIGAMLGNSVGNWLGSKAQVLNAFKPVPHDPNLVAQMGFTRDAGGFANVFLAYPDGTQENANGVVLPPDNNDPRKWHWWGRAQDERANTFIEMPSFAAATGKAVSSFAHAVVVDSQVAGVIGADLDISSVMEELKRTVLPGAGFAFIANSQGKIFAHADPQKLNEPATSLIDGLTPEVMQNIAGGREHTELSFQGSKRLIEVFPVQGTEFRLITVSDPEVLLAPTRALLLKIVLMLLGLLVPVIGLSAFYLRRQLSGLIEIRNAMKDVSQGDADLTHQIPVKSNDEVGQTAQAFNQFVSQLNVTVKGVLQKTVQLTAGVTEVRETMDHIAAEAESMAETASSNAATVEEMSVSISEIASSAQDTEAVAHTAGEECEASAKELKAISNDMEQTRETVDSISHMLETLVQRTEDIQSTTRIINDIAEQTNLLALNAAIEAARAGEQGRGFAVVADEVRKLAESTGKATIQISGMLKSIVDETTNASEKMQVTVTAVGGTADLTTASGERMLEMSGHVRGVLAQISTIARATKEQRSAADAMGQITEDISIRIAKTDADLQSANQRLHTLNELAQAIQGDFSRFKL
ncbi:MAG TPA: methyl-accepting chemotaxis protein [Chitinolyticbacter sp.]|nr:methyl-accepting chemotaxis protein [Chitinolyticbacter sp.]